ncbi:MAG TPA: NAD(P)H-dependent glycerol-3-phosphate dehydrogenase [Caldithrix abyssi]|uniref:Glycerol-3-phosphate dehydrogenase [NAD(P)+] n=1 Tax=Caldithrix abyssi TaxID=187145 RepID=A0A7V4WUF5_CALAY|nr:NAD(P)H-dependent glycerol-3-phosphate dehydrogenase [Caldithrix abyssi]
MRVAMIGAGSWGTALALVLNDNGHEVSCFTIDEDTVKDVRTKKENSKYLPGIAIPENILFSTDLSEVVHGADLIVNAVPSQVTRKALPDVVRFEEAKQAVWVTVSKGIENNTYLRISQVINEVGGIPTDKIVALSGPSHAEEVGKKIPTAVVTASTNLESAKLVQNAFMTPYFRVYASDDVIGVELGGALKNIIALAAGICDGAGFGDNTKAALMTRGLVEIQRLGMKMGAKRETFSGLSGIGDLIVTCMSRHSRNRHVGEQIGKGRKLQEVLDEMVMVAEGVKTTLSAYELAQKYRVEMPITEQIYLTLFKDKSPHQAMIDLMTRESKVEHY